jgi:predicted nuclease of predicted toxin-antitoxin system
VRFLADMGVAPKVVAWLKEQGHDVWHLAERGLERLPDAEIFRRAAEEQRIVLTFDLDFGEILALSGGTTSVILFRLRARRTPHVIERLGSVLAESSLQVTRGAIVVVEDRRHRVRLLPLQGRLADSPVEEA